MSTPSFLPNSKKARGFLLVLLILLLAIGIGGLVSFGSPALQEVAMLVPVAALGLMLGLFRPEILFYVFIGIVFLLGTVQSTVISETYLYFGVGGLLIFTLIFPRLVHRESIPFHKGTIIWALLLGSWVLISAIHSSQLGLGRIYWLVIALFILVPAFLQTSVQLRRFAWVIIVASLLAGLVALWQEASLIKQIGFNGLALYKGVKSATTLDAGGIISTRLLKALPFAVVLLLFEVVRPIGRWVLILSIVVVILTTVFTFSNNGFLGIFLTLLLLMMVLSQGWYKVLIGLLIILGFYLVVTSFIGFRIRDAVDVVLSGEDVSSWGTGRGLIFSLAWRGISASPIFGYGPGQADLVLPNLLPLGYLPGTVRNIAAPHNMLFSIGVDLGVPGIILFLGLYFSVIFNLWTAVRRIQANNQSSAAGLGFAILIALIVFFAQGMLISIQTDKLMWILMGAAVGFSLLAQRGAFAENAQTQAIPSKP